MKKRTLYLLISLLTSTLAFSQSNIKSIQLKPLGKNNFSTIIPLGKTLTLSFDDLEANQKEYSYKIEHMTFDWKPSDISSNEYIEGFAQNSILEYENSFNTLQNYTHYKVQFPNSNIRITKSGNYLVRVLDENDTTVFTRRFTLYKNQSTVGVSVLRSRNTTMANQQQTVQFTVNYNSNTIRNPSQEIKVAVLQNNIWETAITNLTPQFFRNNQLVYKYYNKSDFWSGNEYLNFDNKQIRNSTIQISSVEKRDIYHTFLYTQEPRNNKPYTYFPDINGQFVIRTIEANNSSTESDYAMVHFSLTSEKIFEKEIYVYGAFNDFSLTQGNKMIYNSVSKKYEVAILLKQGFYNYTFITSDSDDRVNKHELNGSFHQTENKYTVLVYYKPFGGTYHQVIGIGTGFINPKE